MISDDEYAIYRLMVQKQSLRVARKIKTQRQLRQELHENDLVEIQKLMETAIKGTPDGDRLELLLTRAHDYENQLSRSLLELAERAGDPGTSLLACTDSSIFKKEE